MRPLHETLFVICECPCLSYWSEIQRP